MSPAVVTIASANYLPYVKTLMQSVKETNPHYRRYFVIVDENMVDGEINDLFEVIPAASLGICTFDDMTVRYEVMELNTAVKPFAIEWILRNTDCSSVIYLDPDIRVYRHLRELEQFLADGASVVLTPHLTEPVEDGKNPNDEHMLRAGVFNLGFIAVSRQAEALRFVAWWGRRLQNACHADFSINQFTDQRWVDLAPCFLANLRVLRNPAYNVAYWNLAQRPVTVKGDSVQFGGKKLAFFHFSGLELKKPRLVSKHQNRLSWRDIEPLQPLFNEYRKRLKLNGWGTSRDSAYSYDWIGDLRLAPKIRRLFREFYPEPLVGAKIDMNFVLAMCNQPADIRHNVRGRLTRLMHLIYRERIDLQTAYPLSSRENVNAFATWFAESADREYDLDVRVTRPTDADRQQTSIIRLPPFARAPFPNQGKPWPYRTWRKARKWIVERI